MRRLEQLDAPLERQRALVGRRLEGHDGRRRRRVVHREVLDDDPIPRLVRGLERLLEPAEPRPIETEVVGHLVELGALFLGDDAVLDHLREELLVHRLELAEAHVAGDLAELETLAGARTSRRSSGCPFRGSSLRAGRCCAQSPKIRYAGSVDAGVDRRPLRRAGRGTPTSRRRSRSATRSAGSKRMDLVEIVGSHASRQLDVQALIAAARMYTDTRSARRRAAGAASRPVGSRRVTATSTACSARSSSGAATPSAPRRSSSARSSSAPTDAPRGLARARALALPTQQSSGMMAVARRSGARCARRIARGRATHRRDSVPRRRRDPGPQERRREGGAREAARRLPAAGRPRPAPSSSASRADIPRLAPSARASDARGIGERPRALVRRASRSARRARSSSTPSSTGSRSIRPRRRAVRARRRPRTSRSRAPREAPPAPESGRPSPFMAPAPRLRRPSPRRMPAAPAPRRRSSRRAPPPELPVNPFLVPPKAPRPVGPERRADARGARRARGAPDRRRVRARRRRRARRSFAWDKPEQGEAPHRQLRHAHRARAAASSAAASGTYYYVNDMRAKPHVESEQLLAQVDKDLARERR